MLPFPILNQYGNVVVKSTIKKMICSSQTIALLYTNGHLYMRGTNQYSSFGVAGGSTTDWTLCKTDVDDVWCGYFHTIVKLQNGEFWCAGFYRSLGTTSGTTTWAKYQKIYDLFTSTGLNGDNIMQIQTGMQGTHVLFTNNKLYSIGYNASYCLLPSSAAASGASVTAFTLSYTGAKKVCTNLNAGMLITTANKLMVIGSSDNYKLGSGNGTLSAWTSPTLPSAYTYISDIHEDYRHTLVYASKDSSGTDASILMAGYNGYNVAGQVPFTSTSSVQTYIVGGSAGVKTFGTGWMSLTYQGFYTDGVSLYTAGIAGANIGSSTNKTSGYTAVQFADSYNGTIDSICVLGQSPTSGACTFVLSNNNIYAIGIASWLGVDTYNLTRQATPE